MIPWKTDAPIYHLPIATVTLIVLNTVAFVASLSAPDVEQVEPWMLAFGDGLHPIQWISSLFLHGDLMHLLGNMIFLWSFGLVIEGKIGWWRFLLVYLGLGAFESAVAQLCMLGGEGFALGASGAIYGLIAMALIWAPSNSMSVFVLLLRPMFFDIPIMGLATLYIGMEVYHAVADGFEISSAMLHLGGAIPGLVVAATMLKFELVDCEDWDLFTVLAGRQGQAKPKKPKPAAQRAAERRESSQSSRTAMLARFVGNLRGGQAADALEIHQRMRQTDREWRISQVQRMELIKALHARKMWTESIGLMEEYLELASDAAPRVRLRLAQILIVHEQRPARALEVLAKIPSGALSGELETTRRQLERHAKKLVAEGAIEVDENGG